MKAHPALKSFLASAATGLAALLLVQCAGTQTQEPPKVVTRPMSAEKIQGMSAMDAELEEVTFKRVPVVTALMVLQRTHQARPQKIPPFMFAIDAGTPAAREGPRANPKVSLRMKNVTLRAVLNELSRQTGWAKKESPDGWRVDFFPAGILPDWALRADVTPEAAR